MKRPLLLLLFWLLPSAAPAFDFSLHQQQGDQTGPTLLVIAGIQGDEPGGFNAAAILATRYRIEKGQLWGEVYRQNRFSGMVLVDFGKPSKPFLLSSTANPTR